MIVLPTDVKVLPLRGTDLLDGGVVHDNVNVELDVIPMDGRLKQFHRQLDIAHE